MCVSSSILQLTFSVLHDGSEHVQDVVYCIKAHTAAFSPYCFVRIISVCGFAFRSTIFKDRAATILCSIGYWSGRPASIVQISRLSLIISGMH